MTLAEQLRDAAAHPPLDPAPLLLALAVDAERLEEALDLIVADAGADARLVAAQARHG